MVIGSIKVKALLYKREAKCCLEIERNFTEMLYRKQGECYVRGDCC